MWCQREIVRADYFFTIPSAVALPITGVWMASLWNLPLFGGWVLIGIGGFVITGLLWLPAAWLQMRMRHLAEQALTRQEELPREFHRANRIWLALGVPAFAIAMLTIWVMVSKWSP